MSVSLGYEVPSEFEVDHKDDDKTNDDPSNLQLLTQEQNKMKEDIRFMEEEQIHYGYTCPVCETNFLLDKRQAYKYISTGSQPSCSKKCGSIRTSFTLKNKK